MLQPIDEKIQKVYEYVNPSERLKYICLMYAKLVNIHRAIIIAFDHACTLCIFMEKNHLHPYELSETQS